MTEQHLKDFEAFRRTIAAFRAGFAEGKYDPEEQLELMKQAIGPEGFTTEGLFHYAWLVTLMLDNENRNIARELEFLAVEVDGFGPEKFLELNLSNDDG